MTDRRKASKPTAHKRRGMIGERRKVTPRKPKLGLHNLRLEVILDQKAILELNGAELVALAEYHRSGSFGLLARHHTGDALEPRRLLYVVDESGRKCELEINVKVIQ